MIPQIAEALNISADDLLGISREQVKKGPASEIEKRFHQVQSLPRRQQRKIIAVIDTLLEVK